MAEHSRATNARRIPQDTPSPSPEDDPLPLLRSRRFILCGAGCVSAPSDEAPPKTTPPVPKDRQIERLRRENERLRER